MVAIIGFTSQAPQLAVWPVPSFGPRNASAVWASYVPRLLFNATFLARFRSNWVNSYFSRFNTRYSTGTTALAYAMTYLATGNTANITLAYNAAFNETFVQGGSGGDGFQVDGAAYVLDWCWPALSPTQRSNLITKLDGNTNTRKAFIANNQYQLHEAQNIGFHAYLFAALAIQSEAGSTDRAAELTRAVQNYHWWLAETSSGLWNDYNYQAGLIGIIQIVWELATGQNISALSGDPSYLAHRYENAIRTFTPDLQHQYTTGIGDQEKRDAGGWLTQGDEASSMMLCGGYLDDPVARFMAVTMSGNGANWNLPYGGSETIKPAWTPMLYFDLAAAQTPPVGVLPLCHAYLAQSGRPGGGKMDASWVSFRDGWTMSSASTDIIAQLYGAFLYTAHPEPGPGHISLQRGMDELLTSASTYCGSGNNPSGVFCPIQANWSLNSFHNNCAVLSPAGSATPDLSGSATTAKRTTNQLTDYPASGNLIWFTNGGSSVAAKVTTFQQSATESHAAVNCDLAYPAALDPMSYTRHVSFIAASKLLIVRDVYTRPNPGRNRFNWWGRSLPTAAGSKAVISRGNSQVTIQCLDPAATLTIFGGTGNEQVIDGVSYPVNTNNCQAGKPIANLAAAVAGQGRATFEVPITSTDVVHALTIDALGSTAPTYTLGQLQALAPLLFQTVQVVFASANLSGHGGVTTGSFNFKRAASAALGGNSAAFIGSRVQSLTPVFLGSASSALTPNLAIQVQQDAIAGDSILVLGFSPDQTTLLATAQDSTGNNYGLLTENIAALSPVRSTLPAGSTIVLNFAGAQAPHAGVAILIRGMTLALAHVTALLQATGTSLVLGSGS